ncbi:hypothetical protein CkaCkLH20_11508 [Colletotrichum karsti]|uniref:Uncharacterized protein n=1 Tax=Colletotrichum karsti TaxID=1095194 RepID=A0A9P6HXX9_9PEZI|nr:uncharacterized protein CkaCkLH20_11508 [Colletotrichum karsti]KAF9871091.1 hypothetical protein CkaCkLH20_11508 [Colletotrichum karsti]
MHNSDEPDFELRPVVPRRSSAASSNSGNAASEQQCFLANFDNAYNVDIDPEALRTHAPGQQSQIDVHGDMEDETEAATVEVDQSVHHADVDPRLHSPEPEPQSHGHEDTASVAGVESAESNETSQQPDPNPRTHAPEQHPQVAVNKDAGNEVGAASAEQEDSAIHSDQAVTDQGSVVMAWCPTWLRGDILAGFAGLFFLITVALTLILWYDSRHDGGIAKSQDGFIHVWGFGPTFFFTIISVFWARTELQALRYMPWIALNANEKLSADESLLGLDYLSMSSPKVLIESIRRKHHLVSLAATISLLLKAQITLSTGLFILSEVGINQPVNVTVMDSFDINRGNWDLNHTNIGYYLARAGYEFGMIYPFGASEIAPGTALAKVWEPSFNIPRAEIPDPDSNSLTVFPEIELPDPWLTHIANVENRIYAGENATVATESSRSQVTATVTYKAQSRLVQNKTPTYVIVAILTAIIFVNAWSLLSAMIRHFKGRQYRNKLLDMNVKGLAPENYNSIAVMSSLLSESNLPTYLPVNTRLLSSEELHSMLSGLSFRMGWFQRTNPSSEPSKHFTIGVMEDENFVFLGSKEDMKKKEADTQDPPS